ncbi:hypothetical protein RJ641_008529 [Dillenia turbinata]|uniref:Uncharacterized protein n=1 Tax=Dillenia turbinata TaxID=194707 RepID=A0AAN8V3I1_9MAGN
MEINSTPLFPSKSQASKQRTTNKEIMEAQKPISKDLPKQGSKRVFGTARSTNVILKPTTEKPMTKPRIVVTRKPTKQVQESPRTGNNDQVKPNHATQNKDSSDKPKPGSAKNSVCFQERSKISVPENNNSVNTPVQTPARSPAPNKPRISGTPYHTAENCSKCRFDRLETSSYWLSQIKLAESVGKHFVSAAFFRLALESKAEPTRNLRVELKKYMARHGHLASTTEWREVSKSYGLYKEENNAAETDSAVEIARMSDSVDAAIAEEEQELKPTDEEEQEVKPTGWTVD